MRITVRIQKKVVLKKSNYSRSTHMQTSGGSRGGGKIISQGKPREKEIINPNKLRILGGVAKGKKIDSPDVYLRPMMAKVCRIHIHNRYTFMYTA